MHLPKVLAFDERAFQLPRTTRIEYSTSVEYDVLRFEATVKKLAEFSKRD